MLPTIGIFAAAAFRILPTSNRFLTAIQRLKYARPVINILFDELQIIKSSKNISKEIDTNEVATKEKIVIKNKILFRISLTLILKRKGYNDLSLSIEKGSVIEL